MKNLAGVATCDRDIRRELTRARIEIVENLPARGEVPATLQGKLGPITFTRAWYYWVADGPVPIDVARALYADPIGRDDVRSGGHCGCPAPDEYGAEYYDENGARLYSDPDGSEAARFARMIESGIILHREDGALSRFVPDNRIAATTAVVRCYHIDSEAGLRLFADAIRGMEVSK